MKGFQELSTCVVWQQSQENWAGISPLWFRLGSSSQQHLLILLNCKCLLVLWATLTFPSSPRWPCCLCATWMSPHGRSVQLIQGQHQAGEYMWRVHHREAQGLGSYQMTIKSILALSMTIYLLETQFWWLRLNLDVVFLSLFPKRGKWICPQVGSAAWRSREIRECV